MKNLNFFNLDLHISVIEDVKRIFIELGHSVDSWCISGHNWVLNKTTPKVDIINSQNWMSIDESMCESFYQRYKNELSHYDGFIVTYPPVFSKLFAKFKKPIIMYVPIRYEVPYGRNSNEWENFNKFLIEGIDKEKIIPVANSLYDKKYCEYFLKREFNYIPSLCEYTNIKWEPQIDKFLYFSKLNISLGNNLINKSALGKYVWSDLGKFKGIVHIPYTSSTMSIFEHYSSNIPLFFPNKEFLLNLYTKFGNNGVLSELTWNQIFKYNDSIVKSDACNPNNICSLDNLSKWIEYSDFYNEEMHPHLIYFNSIDDLQRKLKNTDLILISDKMRTYNIFRRKNIFNAWRTLLNKYF